MNCRNYSPKTSTTGSAKGKAVTMVFHDCVELDGNPVNQAIVQRALLPQGLCGSVLPARCPVAILASTEWPKCPLYRI